MNANLLLGRLRTDLRGTLIYSASVAFFMLVVLSSYTAVAGSSAMLNVFNQLPPAFTALMGGDIARILKIQGYVGVGYVHPIMIAILAAFVIGIAVRAIAGEIDRGTINLLLARPVRRRDLVLTAFVQLLIGLGIISLALVIGIWVGLQTLGKLASGVEPSAVLSATLLTLLFFLAIGAYSLLFSAASSDAGRATLFGAGLTLIFYFLNYLAQLSPDFKSLGSLSIFHFWDPGAALIANRFQWNELALFAALSILLTLAAVIVIERRDITS